MNISKTLEMPFYHVASEIGFLSGNFAFIYCHFDVVLFLTPNAGWYAEHTGRLEIENL